MIGLHVSPGSGQTSSLPLRSHLRRVWLTIFMLSLVALALSHSNGSAQAGSATHSATRTIWLQVMDSCQQAIPGARFTLTGNGLNVAKGPAPGTGPQTVSPTQGGCPLQRGNCAKVPTGCLTWSIPTPAKGTATYQIKETAAAQNYVPCTGGSVCSGGPLVVTFTIGANSNVAATARNMYPDRVVVVWPTSGSPYTATQADPIAVHNFELGNISCDGDNDADDHLTGSPSSHCDSDGDR